MRLKPLSSSVTKLLVLAAVTLSLTPGAWAKPKFKVLAQVPGGLWTGLTLDAKGNLYGVTSGGGVNNVGSVFELMPNANGKWTATTLHSFNGTDGTSPNGNMIFDAAGNLYGTTAEGGTYVSGTAFELTPGSGGWTFTDFYDFCHTYGCPDGGDPSAGFVMDAAGNLYDSAPGGTCHGFGVAFEFTPGSGGWGENILFDWGCRNYDTTSSYAPLIFDKSGNLYGTGSLGRYEGTVFELEHGSGEWKERLLYQFCPRGNPCLDGARPYYGVAFDGRGDLYGTTSTGGRNTCGETNCGTVFKLTRTQNGIWRETVLYDFKPGESGSFPGSGVLFGKGGALYGTAALGGNNGCNGGCGVVYKLAPNTRGNWKYSVLHRFTGQDGGYPQGGLIFDNDGNLYGTAVTVAYEIVP
jgi:uncharacterized repeat protein (TIGR03803 family)